MATRRELDSPPVKTWRQRRVGAVVLDVVEQQRRPGAGALRQPRDGAELDVPIDLGVDRAAVRPAASSACDPAAQIAERDRLSFSSIMW